jgi:hypothetical protein
MRYSIPISILACSVGFAMATSPPDAKPQGSDEPVLRAKERAVPVKENATDRKNPEKAPTPKENQAPPKDEDQDDSPAEAEDISDCDDCVIAMTTSSESGPQAILAASASIAGAAKVAKAKAAAAKGISTLASAGVSAAKAASGPRSGGWPMALARTLWGLFFVGRPRLMPKTRIRGVTVR